MELRYQELDFGVTQIEGWHDRVGMTCSYLIEQSGAVALIDTGTARVAPHILELLQLRGIAPEAVRYIIPTHVHLDHAGGAGQLMAALPEATLVIHPTGARHMIDPGKLQAGATAVYGEEAFERSFGTLVPIASERVVEINDGMEIDLNGRTLQMVDTPGHARHHLCVWDAQSEGHFTGDVFGNGYPELECRSGRYLTPVTSPVQLDPPAWHQSIDKLLSFNPQRAYLTHYGVLEAPQSRSGQLHQDLDALVKMATEASVLPPEARYEQLLEQVTSYHLRQLDSLGCSLDEQEIVRLIGSDNVLCAQGLEVWIQRQERV